ncbi:MAG: hypothetical protein II950_05230 [Prevotella sp.]|nr:hypothetical protein [Prevotella sp.]
MKNLLHSNDATLFILGYVFIKAGDYCSWKPLIWIGITIFLLGLGALGWDTLVGWRKKTLTGWRLGLKICGLVLGILLLISSVMVTSGVEYLHLSF